MTTGNENPEKEIPEGDVSPEDPLALYKDHRFLGPPTSRFDAFRRFAIRNRRIVYGLLLIGIVGSFGIMMTDRHPESAEALVRSYFARFTSASDSYAYSIGDYRIQERQLKELYPALLKYTWGQKGAEGAESEKELYSDFVRDQFETDILVNAALKEGRLNSPEAKLVIENAVRHAVADYYLYTRLASPETNFRIQVPREQVLALYEKNKDFYTRQGLDKAQAMPVIERSIAGVRRDEVNILIARIREQVLVELKDRSGYIFKGPERK